MTYHPCASPSLTAKSLTTEALLNLRGSVCAVLQSLESGIEETRDSMTRHCARWWQHNAIPLGRYGTALEDELAVRGRGRFKVGCMRVACGANNRTTRDQHDGPPWWLHPGNRRLFDSHLRMMRLDGLLRTEMPEGLAKRINSNREDPDEWVDPCEQDRERSEVPLILCACARDIPDGEWELDMDACRSVRLTAELAEITRLSIFEARTGSPPDCQAPHSLQACNRLRRQFGAAMRSRKVVVLHEEAVCKMLGFPFDSGNTWTIHGTRVVAVSGAMPGDRERSRSALNAAMKAKEPLQ